MTTRLTIRFAVLLTAVVGSLLGPGTCLSADAEASPLNVVMLISDDQAWTDYGFMGHPDIRTPHLDQFARESVVFRRGYVPTALCRPSLLTMLSTSA